MKDRFSIDIIMLKSFISFVYANFGQATYMDCRECANGQHLGTNRSDMDFNRNLIVSPKQTTFHQEPSAAPFNSSRSDSRPERAIHSISPR